MKRAALEDIVMDMLKSWRAIQNDIAHTLHHDMRKYMKRRGGKSTWWGMLRAQVHLVKIVAAYATAIRQYTLDLQNLNCAITLNAYSIAHPSRHLLWG